MIKVRDGQGTDQGPYKKSLSARDPKASKKGRRRRKSGSGGRGGRHGGK